MDGTVAGSTGSNVGDDLQGAEYSFSKLCFEFYGRRMDADISGFKRLCGMSGCGK